MDPEEGRAAAFRKTGRVSVSDNREQRGPGRRLRGRGLAAGAGATPAPAATIWLLRGEERAVFVPAPSGARAGDEAGVLPLALHAARRAASAMAPPAARNRARPRAGLANLVDIDDLLTALGNLAP